MFPPTPKVEIVTSDEIDKDWEIFELILPDLIALFKSKYNNKKLKSIITEIKEICDEYSGCQTDSVLETISNAVIDLTLSNDDEV